jgi:hypothetical protein
LLNGGSGATPEPTVIVWMGEGKKKLGKFEKSFPFFVDDWKIRFFCCGQNLYLLYINKDRKGFIYTFIFLFSFLNPEESFFRVFYLSRCMTSNTFCKENVE